jgi:hypothetical protein
MLCLPTAAALLLLAGADVCFEQTTVVGSGGRVQGAGVVTRVCHSGGQKMRLEAAGETGGPAFVLRLDQGRAFRLDPARKQVVLVDTTRLRAQAKTDLAMAGDLMGLAAARPKTTPLARPHTIAGYLCQGYRITAGETIFDLYVSEKVPLKVDVYADFLEWAGARDSLGGILDQIRALPGFPLETRSHVSVMGETQETATTVTKVTIAPLPRSLFEAPAGWEVVKEEEEE